MSRQIDLLLSAGSEVAASYPSFGALLQGTAFRAPNKDLVKASQGELGALYPHTIAYFQTDGNTDEAKAAANEWSLFPLTQQAFMFLAKN